MTLIDKAEALAIVNDYWQSIGGGLPEGPSDEAILDTMNAIAQRIAALPARGVGVKPLVWDHHNGNYPNWKAQSYPFSAIIEQHSWQGKFGLTINGFPKGPHLTLDAAKAAAQADYEARILAALAPTDAHHVNETPKSEHDGADVLTAAQAREAALHPDAMLPEAIRLIRQEATRDHSQEVVTGLKHIALLLEQLIGEDRT